MNWKPSKVGAEPKKLAFLALLVFLAGFLFFYNRNSGDAPVAAPQPSGAAPPAATRPIARPGARTGVRVTRQGISGDTREFRPSLKVTISDPSAVDPTLHLDLLARLKDVPLDAGARSLFEVAAAPPEAVKVKEPDKIKVAQPFVGPMPPKPAEPPPAPKAPPIPLKFYGFVNKTKLGDKRAFFLNGDDIIIAAEGDVVEKRYKIVRIGVNSAVVEDTQFKSNNQQTLPLEAEMAG